MPRTTRALPGFAAPLRVRLTGGNGAPSVESPSDRVDRIERLLEAIQKQLDVQFQRIADLQVQLDRAIADTPLPRR